MNLVLTGSTSGIGWETLKALLPHFDHVFLPVRNLEKAKKMIHPLTEKHKIQLIPMDLSLMKSVQEGVQHILKSTDKVHVLINNAGGMYPGGKLTEEKLDLTFATNHLGHFLLTLELLPLLKNGQAKIINVSSEAHRLAASLNSDWGLRKAGNTINAYGKVKLYNILFTKELKRRYEDQGIQAYALHPGAVKTAFGSETSLIAKAIIRATQLLFISPKAGANTSIFLAMSPKDQLKNGGYFDKKKPKTPAAIALDPKPAEELWNYSLKTLQDLRPDSSE
ncbi:SDR family NAD(P)-dependent oxidoreductase [Algoriphagus confluentis]|uniref:SDR family oxidoreductase n=1 Tax=Algoriphagus confluentis TaxID=1697556 RepID=A0ABQ6PKJ4_9BACT|nr:SDR family oxidoreductase [Algoriphagus confluentis]